MKTSDDRLGVTTTETYCPALVGLAAALLARLDQITENIAGAILSDVEFHRASELIAADDLRRTLQAHLRFVFAPLGTGRHGFDTSEARDTGRRRAAAGVPLAALMHSYRVGAREVWRTIIEEAKHHADVSADDLLAAASDIWLMHDQFSQAMADGYRDELNVQVLEREAERSALVQAVLEGRVVDSTTVWDAADVLGISRHGPYVVVAAEALTVGRHVLPGIMSQLSDVGIASAWRLTPDTEIGIVCVPERRDVNRLVDGLERVGAAARIGVSPVVASLQGIARAVHCARVAMTASRGEPPAVVVFDRSPLAVVAVAAPDIMESVVKDVLGNLMDLPDDERETLLGTLETWVHNGGSANAAAALLFCHANTVRHRLHRIESYTGRSLTDPVDLSALCVALEATRRLGGVWSGSAARPAAVRVGTSPAARSARHGA